MHYTAVQSSEFNAILDTTIQYMHYTAVQTNNPDNSSRPNDIYITQVLCIEKYFDLVFFTKIFDICWLRYRLNSAWYSETDISWTLSEHSTQPIYRELSLNTLHSLNTYISVIITFTLNSSQSRKSNSFSQRPNLKNLSRGLNMVGST